MYAASITSPLANVNAIALDLVWRMPTLTLTEVLGELRGADSGVLRRLLTAQQLPVASDEGRASLIIRCVALYVDVARMDMAAWDMGYVLDTPTTVPLSWANATA